MPYVIEYREEFLGDGRAVIVAEHPELPGCYGFGQDYDEAEERLDRAREAYISSLRERGLRVPEPSVQFIWMSASGPPVEDVGVHDIEDDRTAITA